LIPIINNMKGIESVCVRVAQVFEASVKRNLGQGLLLSGGLDTSIIAGLAAKWSKPDCITVALRNSPSPDIDYSKRVAGRFNLNHYIHYFGEDELEEGIFTTIKVLKTFDPMEIRNSAAAYVGLKIARDKGLATVMTGDAGDELLAGYSFFFDLTKERLENALKEMWRDMSFSSIPLARHLAIEAKLPFLDPEFKALAMSLDSSFKVNQEKGEVFGKWILRKAFESLISPEIAWRVKAPLEVGTGTTILPSFFASRISQGEYNQKKDKYRVEDKVIIRSQEHLHYYEIYRKEIGIPGGRAGNGRICPDCGSSVDIQVNYCRTCGAYPI
jgi:asparagine synthase (glutamine-hydrolysing)